ncbi:MAG: hypothetical protein HY901_19915 [Deltaproteobacteria bacterium]|nr:hypothetical protein [Deltaproteobacteria bacterium]
MPVSLEAFRHRVASSVKDHKLTAAEAQQLIAEGPLTAEQQQVLRDELKSEYFASDAERNQALALFRMAPDTLRSNESDGLLDKVKDKLVDLAKDQIYRSRDLSIADFKLGDHAGICVRTQVKPLRPDDPLVVDDPHRAATTQRMEAAWQKVTWATVGGGIYPRAGFTFSLPAGAARVSAGFNSKASLGYSVLAPYPLETSAAGQLAKNLSVDLPFNPENAKALAEGTEVRLVGRGTVAANAGVGVGAQLADLGNFISVGASAGVNVGVSREGSVSLTVKRLEGDKVFVSLSTLESTTGSGSVGARVGVTASLRDNLPELGGDLFEQGGESVAKKIEKQISKWTSADLSVAHSRAKSEKVVQSYTIDLSQAEGAKAYSDLLRLDTRTADTLGAQGASSGVSFARLDQVGRTSSTSANLKLGKLALLQAASSHSEAHGTLRSAQGELTFDRARLDENYSGILSNIWAGKRATSAELIQTRQPGEPVESFLHLTQTVRGDKVTSRNDVRKFIELSSFLGAESDSLQGLADNGTFLDSFGKTDRTVDFFITDEGLQALGQVSPEQVQKAFGAAYEKLDRPWDMHYLIGDNQRAWRNTPWLATDHPRHGDIMKMLRSDSISFRAQDLEGRYRFLTGRNLTQDRAAWRDSEELSSLVSRLQQAATPAARAHVFAKANASLDLQLELATLASLAGADQVLVNNVSLHDTKSNRDLTLVHEGVIQDPQAEIDRILADPR